MFSSTHDSLTREISKKMVVREKVLALEDGELAIGTHGALSRKIVVSAVVVGSLLLSSCVPVVNTGIPKPLVPTNNPAITETFITPTDTGMETPTSAAVTEIPNATTTETEIATTRISDIPTATTLEIPTDVVIQKPTESGLFSLIPKLEGITDSFCVDQRTYNDFFDKKIPLQEDLRVGEDNLVKNIGEYEIDAYENHSTIVHIQLFMMGGFVNNDGLYLIVGTQDENGKRFILPIQMTFGITGSISNTMMIIDGNETKKIKLAAVGLNNVSGEESLEYARQNMGRVVVIQLLLDTKGTGQPRPEFIEADEKYSLVERMESNIIFYKDPKELEITDFKNTPWGQLIVFSN